MLAGLLALSCMNKVDTSETIPSEQDWHIVNSTVSFRGEREEILYPDNTAFTVRKDSGTIWLQAASGSATQLRNSRIPSLM